MARMRITDGKGVQFEFDNGVTVSIQIGRGNYGDNYDWPGGWDAPTRENPLPWSTRAEVACWDSEGVWFDLVGDQVAGYVPVEDVLAFVEYLRSLPTGVSAKAIQLDTKHLERK